MKRLSEMENQKKHLLSLAKRLSVAAPQERQRIKKKLARLIFGR